MPPVAQRCVGLVNETQLVPPTNARPTSHRRKRTGGFSRNRSKRWARTGGSCSTSRIAPPEPITRRGLPKVIWRTEASRRKAKWRPTGQLRQEGGDRKSVGEGKSVDLGG